MTKTKQLIFACSHIIIIAVVMLSITSYSFHASITSYGSGSSFLRDIPNEYEINKNRHLYNVYLQQVFGSSGNQNLTTPSDSQASMEVVGGSLLLSLLIVLFLFFFVNWGIRTSIKTETVTKFGDIIRDGGGFPSLARFQFLFWTFIVMFAVLSVFFTRLFMGNSEIPTDIPENLLILMGISIAVPFVSMPLSGIKYGDRKPSKGIIDDADRRPLSSMLMENGKITVSRFQMFAWTWISIIIYLGYFFSQILTSNISDLSVPDIPQIFVFLMGLTQAGYVGSKAAIPETVALTKISPSKGERGTPVSIYGTNFGKQKGKVLFETGAVNEEGSQIYVESDAIKWNGSQIEVTVPRELDLGEYFIRVEANGFVTFKGGGQNEESKFIVME